MARALIRTARVGVAVTWLLGLANRTTRLGKVSFRWSKLAQLSDHLFRSISKCLPRNLQSKSINISKTKREQALRTARSVLHQDMQKQPRKTLSRTI